MIACKLGFVVDQYIWEGELPNNILWNSLTLKLRMYLPAGLCVAIRPHSGEKTDRLTYMAAT